jgi:hypothetical protein
MEAKMLDVILLPFYTNGVPFNTNGVPFNTNRVPLDTDIVLFNMNGVPFDMNGNNLTSSIFTSILYKWNQKCFHL